MEFFVTRLDLYAYSDNGPSLVNNFSFSIMIDLSFFVLEVMVCFSPIEIFSMKYFSLVKRGHDCIV